MNLDALSLQERRARSALVIVVPEIVDLTGPYRRAHTADGTSVPPHITLASPFLAPAEITGSVRERIAHVSATVPKFDFELARIDRFPGGVMYLAPDPPGPFIELIARYREAFPEVSPYWDRFETIVPHSTVADASLAGSANILDDIEGAISSYLPVQCTATVVTLLQRVRPSSAPWDVQGQFPLKSDSGQVGRAR